MQKSDALWCLQTRLSHNSEGGIVRRGAGSGVGLPGGDEDSVVPISVGVGWGCGRVGTGD